MTHLYNDYGDNPEVMKQLMVNYLENRHQKGQLHMFSCLKTSIHSSFTFNESTEGIKTVIDSGATFDMHHHQLRKSVKGQTYYLKKPVIINQGQGSMIELIQRFVPDKNNPNRIFVLLTPSLATAFDQPLDIMSARTAATFGLGMHMPPANMYNKNSQDTLYNFDKSVEIVLQFSANGIPYFIDIGLAEVQRQKDAKLIDAYTGKPFNEDLAIKRAKSRFLNKFLSIYGESKNSSSNIDNRVNKFIAKMASPEKEGPPHNSSTSSPHF